MRPLRIAGRLVDLCAGTAMLLELPRRGGRGSTLEPRTACQRMRSNSPRICSCAVRGIVQLLRW